MRKTSIDSERAATVSLRVLAFLAEDAVRLQRFLNLTGMRPDALASMAAEAHFQKALLEYILADERLLLEFCEKEAFEPTLPAAALHVLSALSR